MTASFFDTREARAVQRRSSSLRRRRRPIVAIDATHRRGCRASLQPPALFRTSIRHSNKFPSVPAPEIARSSPRRCKQGNSDVLSQRVRGSSFSPPLASPRRATPVEKGILSYAGPRSSALPREILVAEVGRKRTRRSLFLFLPCSLAPLIYNVLRFKKVSRYERIVHEFLSLSVTFRKMLR